jgi:hypothetical protein
MAMVGNGVSVAKIGPPYIVHNRLRLCACAYTLVFFPQALSTSRNITVFSYQCRARSLGIRTSITSRRRGGHLRQAPMFSMLRLLTGSARWSSHFRGDATPCGPFCNSQLRLCEIFRLCGIQMGGLGRTDGLSICFISCLPCLERHYFG